VAEGNYAAVKCVTVYGDRIAIRAIGAIGGKVI